MLQAGGTYPEAPSGPAPGYNNSGVGQPKWPASGEVVIHFQNSDKKADCTDFGRDGPGGFGDIQAGTGCSTEVSTNDWVVGDNGKNIANPCRASFAALRGTVIDLPVFDCLFINNSAYTGTVAAAPRCDGGSGGTYNYHIKGWAKFYLSGYMFPGLTSTSLVTGSKPCANNESCVSGWFLSGELHAKEITEPGGDNDYGTYAVLPAG